MSQFDSSSAYNSSDHKRFNTDSIRTDSFISSVQNMDSSTAEDIYFDKTSDDNMTNVKETIERKGLSFNPNAANRPQYNTKILS